LSNDLRKFDDNVIDLSQFREKKQQAEVKAIEPFFKEPTIITLGDATDTTKQMQYMLLVNLVVNDKQFLALESMEKEDRGNVAIVEALIVDGEFSGVQVVSSEEEFEEVSRIISEALDAQVSDLVDEAATDISNMTDEEKYEAITNLIAEAQAKKEGKADGSDT
jgi:hypothetical protein